MSAADNPSACSGLPAMERCKASLPDNPQCAPNYHFGMLLGVEDFQAEQGFHSGRLRRHQRLLHGAGVVAGFRLDYDPASFELKLGPGYAIDAEGRNLTLDGERCVNLALWWDKHRTDEDFGDVEPGVTRFDLDVVACYANCLDRPVPAIAEPCAGNASDIAYSRICETVDLALARHRQHAAAAAPGDYHLLRLWLGLEPAARDAEGRLLPDDRWLTDALAALRATPPGQQEAAYRELAREVQGRAVAATPALEPDAADQASGCLTLARLRGVKVSADAGTKWTVQVEALEFGPRATRLPTRVLQDLLLARPPAGPAPAGPVVVAGGASLSGSEVKLVFDQKLAAASVGQDAFRVSEFDTAQGWRSFAPGAPVYDEGDAAGPAVTLPLDRAPSGRLLRIGVIGTGSAPLLGSTLVPAGALCADSDGRDLTTTLSI